MPDQLELQPSEPVVTKEDRHEDLHWHESLGGNLRVERRQPGESKREAVARVLLEAAKDPRRVYRVPVDDLGLVSVSGGWVPSTVLVDMVGWRYSARLFDAKKKEPRLLRDYESRPLIVQGEATSVWLFRAVL